MKPLSTHRITQFIAAAALAGISIVSAYAAPNYITPAESPIDTSTITTAGGSVSTPLNNFNTYLSAIQTQLDSSPNVVTGDTVRTPNFGVGGVAVKAADFAAAVGAAVANPANLGNEVAIVSAAVQYMPTNVKNILKAAATANAANAPAFVAAAAQVYPIGAASAAAGAIAGLIASSASGANNILMDDAAAAAAIATTRDLIANVAKQAVLATKLAKIGVVPVADGANRAKEVAAGLMHQFLIDAGTAGSNAALYLDDVGRGAASGAAAFSSVDLTKSDIAVAMIKEFALHGHSALNTEHNVVNFAMGAVKSALSGVTPSANSAEGVALALRAEATVGVAHDAAIEVGSRVQLAVRNGVADQVGAFNTALTPADYAHIYAALSGAVQGSPGKAGLFVTAAFDTVNNAPPGVGGRPPRPTKR